VAYPIVLNLSDRLIVVVGGGSVALRKVLGLVAGGATRIRVVSLSFHEMMPAESSILQRVYGAYDAKYLEGASLVFAATDSPEVNDAVVRDAHARGALVCRADVDEENAGDFSTPAMLRDGAMLITVSSGGSPALSAMIRDRIKQSLDPRWTKMADAMQLLRPKLRGSLAPARRKAAFVELCSDEALRQLQEHGLDGLQRWLSEKFPELSDIV
jgi:precorrin-2 dehydrogenase/sirohydrochlorin ferrochelatase